MDNLNKYDESIDMASASDDSDSNSTQSCARVIPPPPSRNLNFNKAMGIGVGELGGSSATDSADRNSATVRQRYNTAIRRGLNMRAGFNPTAKSNYLNEGLDTISRTQKKNFDCPRNPNPTQKLITGFQSGALNPGISLEQNTDSDDDTNLSSFLDDDDDDTSSACFLGEEYERHWIDSVMNEIPCPYKTFTTPPIHDDVSMKEYMKLIDIWELQIDMKRSRLAEFVQKNCTNAGVHDDACIKYNAEDYSNIKVPREIQDIFKFITQHKLPPSIHQKTSDKEETKLRPFIPDYYPSVGDIDAFLKVIEPQADDPGVGLQSLDEPSLHQSDPSLLGLKLKALARHRSESTVLVKSVENVSENTHIVDKWIKDITDLHRAKPSPSVHFAKPMPDIDSLLQEWPPEVEEQLKTKNLKLPDPGLSCDLATYAEIVCNMMDIPVYKSKVQSLHVLFTLYAAYKDFKTESLMDVLNLEKCQFHSATSEDHAGQGDQIRDT